MVGKHNLFFGSFKMAQPQHTLHVNINSYYTKAKRDFRNYRDTSGKIFNATLSTPRSGVVITEHDSLAQRGVIALGQVIEQITIMILTEEAKEKLLSGIWQYKQGIITWEELVVIAETYELTPDELLKFWEDNPTNK
jgi:hypothetical protein